MLKIGADIDSIGYTRKIFSTGMDLWKYPRVIRGFVAPFTKGVRELHADRQVVKSFVRPRVEERIEQLNTGTKSPPDDILQWFFKNAPEQRNDIEWHARQQLGLSVASIHTTGMLLAQCLFDLATHVEYQDILRSELVDKLETDGNHVRKQMITKLKKLDSFVREVMRLAPPGLTSLNRLVTAEHGITLSNGVHLAKGSYISAPSAQVAMDPSLWTDPEKFDGLRFFRLRQAAGNENKYQLVTVNQDSVVWGQG